MEHLQYPVGKYNPPAEIKPEHIQQWITEIEAMPSLMKAAVKAFTAKQWQTAYRPEGWTGQQVVHHVAESHMNAFIRVKLALTEDNPTIKPYLENKWANLPDVNKTAPEISIQLLEALHIRWVTLLRCMATTDFERTFFHPEKQSSMTLAYATGLYAWHCRHHVGHLEIIRKSN